MQSGESSYLSHMYIAHDRRALVSYFTHKFD